MALKGILTLALAGTTLLASMAVEANSPIARPGVRGPAAPIPGGPVPPGFGNPGDDRGGRGDWGRDRGSQRFEEKSVFIGRRLVNEELALRQLLQLNDRDFGGREVEEVRVSVRQGGPRAMLRLMINGIEEDRADLYSSVISLRVRGPKKLGQEINTLRVRVDGQVFVDSVTVVLRQDRFGRPDRPGRPGEFDRVETVNLNVRARLFGNSRVDLMRAIDMHRYHGYRILSIDIDAAALNRAALLDVTMNGRAISPTETVTNAYRLIRFVPQNAVLGLDVRGLELITRGDIDIYGINMVISRR
ncbi:MAG: hypothetical protein ACLGGX_02665 [Bdellovibrionia bacterium]